MQNILVNNRFRITEILGTGGMAAVFLSMDEKLDVHRAIKILAPEFSKLPQVRKRFISEATTMAKLQHPNVVTVFDFGDIGESLYIIMEIMDGGSLDDLIKEHQGLPYGQAAWITKEIIKGLAIAHEKGIIHRDMKPDNVLIGKGDVPKITDFGIASVQDENSRITRSGAVMGTLNYMPPEQRIDSSKVSAQSDYYSVICTFFEMITQKEPLDLYDEDARQRLLIDLPVELQKFITKGTSYKPEDRHQSPEELFVELDEIITLYKDKKFLQLYQPNAVIKKKLVTQTANNVTQEIYSKYTGEKVILDQNNTINSMDEGADHFEDDSGTDTFFFDDEEDVLQTKPPKEDTVVPQSSRSDTFFDFGLDEEEVSSNDALKEETTQNSDAAYTEEKIDKNIDSKQGSTHERSNADSLSEPVQEQKTVESTTKGNTIFVLVGLVMAIILLAVFSMSSSQPEEMKTDVSSTINQKDTQPDGNQVNPPEKKDIPPKDNPVANEKLTQATVTKQEVTENQKESKKQSSSSGTKTKAKTTTTGSGTLLLSSRPAAKSISVDGIKRKSRMGKVELDGISVGQHKIIFETMKGEKHTKTITVKKDKVARYCWDFLKDKICK